MSATLDEIIRLYTQETLDNYAELNYALLVFSASHLLGSLIPKVSKGKVEGVTLIPTSYGVALQMGKSTLTYIPTNTREPKVYLKEVMTLIAKYGVVSNIPNHFAAHIKGLGYKVKPRPKDNRDYIFDNNALQNFSGGAFKKDRYYHRRNEGIVDFCYLTKEDEKDVRAFEELWRGNFLKRNPSIRVHKNGFLANALSIIDNLPEACRSKFIGARLKATGQLVMAGNGELCSSSVWGSTFRYVDTDLMPNGASSCLHLLSNEFSDIAYEVDGSGGDFSESGLCQFKEHFVTESVVNKQLHFFSVSK